MITSIKYNGKPVQDMYLHSDINSPHDPEEMRQHREYYLIPEQPQFFMTASQVRDMINIIRFVDERVGAPQFNIYLDLQGEEKLVRMDDYNLFQDM